MNSNPNTGHGHVFPRADGMKARCGGPDICAECSREAARVKAGKALATVIGPKAALAAICNLCGASDGQSCQRPSPLCPRDPPPQTRTVIAFAGKAGSGKSTAAKYLIEVRDFRRIKWASGLKEMLRAFLRYRGASEDLIERALEGDLKEVPSPYLNGRTPRYAMQTLGTEWGRVTMHPDLWVDTEVDALPTHGRFVSDDTRFPNEVVVVHNLDGIIVRIVRPDASGAVGDAGAHVSETNELPADVVIENTGSIPELLEKVDRLVLGTVRVAA